MDAFNDELESFKERVRARAKVRIEEAMKKIEEVGSCLTAWYRVGQMFSCLYAHTHTHTHAHTHVPDTSPAPIIHLHMHATLHIPHMHTHVVLCGWSSTVVVLSGGASEATRTRWARSCRSF